MVYQYFVYYDNQDPEFNLSLIPNGSITETNIFNFSISDDYNIDINTLLLNVTNGTESKYYSYNSSYFQIESEDNIGFDEYLENYFNEA